VALFVRADDNSNNTPVPTLYGIDNNTQSGVNPPMMAGNGTVRPRMMARQEIQQDRQDFRANMSAARGEFRAEMNATRQAFREQEMEKVRQFQAELKANGSVEIGRGNMNITVKQLTSEQKEIIAGKIDAKTGLNLTADDIGNGTALRAILSNGNYSDIRVMPIAASLVALNKLQARCDAANCTVELKEVGNGNNEKAAYEVQTQKGSTFLFFFHPKMTVKAQVDADTGQIISVSKPWWSFMAKEQNANETEISDSVGTDTTNSTA
jgi:hypothetical protein